MAGPLGRLAPGIGRQARAALIMDSADLRHDVTALHQAYPGLPCTSLSTCLSERRPAGARSTAPIWSRSFALAPPSSTANSLSDQKINRRRHPSTPPPEMSDPHPSGG